jgi:small subunit ribosomal protein S18
VSALKCPVCEQGIAVLDWKTPKTLATFLDSRGGLKSKDQSGLCTQHQSLLKKQVERARKIALLPYPANEHS